ncbi:Phosphorylase superfamily [Geosmithia morbida]|uniref:Phosphorylase superfamily n=1 Tax=Geosmithia morbida TaxID=1094350 RepID=A0A9P4Z002_9HYPO|nr:Phosphorylase superfamily [Geosmithia morbida]KAF4124753.1 Phosphorylase superfamily [Geosmithia morbida]
MSHPALSEFQIGWLCVLPIELAAAKEMLDENFGGLHEQDGNDPNSYILGRIGRHHVVITQLGTAGTTAATAAVINMKRTFPQLRLGLMVGVGGGIPSNDHDVRLGDVVVSYPERTCGGVIQYDAGKMHEEKFVRAGLLNAPPRSLLGAVTGIRAAAITDDPKSPEYVDGAISRNKRTRQNFGRPSPSTDRLFRPDKPHPVDAKSCSGCPSAWEQSRIGREEGYPQVHYGIVASGNTSVRSAAMRDRVYEETGALCFKTEAAGIMMDFPSIVICGICDYSDSHENNIWQGYAATVAAAYSKELLSYLPTQKASYQSLDTDICKQLVGEVRNIAHKLQKVPVQRDSYLPEATARVLMGESRWGLQESEARAYEQSKNVNLDHA